MSSSGRKPFNVIDTSDSTRKQNMITKHAAGMSETEKKAYKAKLRQQMNYVMQRATQFLLSRDATRFLAQRLTSYPNFYTFDSRIPTGATDGSKMMFNIPFILSLYQPEHGTEGFRDVAAAAYIIAHEICHPFLGHFTRDKSIKDPDDKVYRNRVNVAMDQEVNSLLVHLGMAHNSSMILFYGDDPPYPNMTASGTSLYQNPNAEAVYTALRNVPDQYFAEDQTGHSGNKKNDLDEDDEDLNDVNEEEEDQQDEQDSGNAPPKGKKGEKKEKDDKKPQGQKNKQKDKEKGDDEKDDKDKEKSSGGKSDDSKDKEKEQTGGITGDDDKEDEVKDKTSAGSFNETSISNFSDPVVSKMIQDMEKMSQDIAGSAQKRMEAEAEANRFRQQIIDALKSVDTEEARNLANMMMAQMAQATRASGFWKKTLRMFVRNSNLKELSWNRLSRRFIPYRIYIPKEKDQMLSMSIGFDLSLSMQIEDMKAFMLEIESILKSFSKNYRILIHTFSTPVHRGYSVEFDNKKNRYSAEKFEQIVRTSRESPLNSGTDFDDIISVIAQDCKDRKYLSMGGIIFTDGMGDAKAYPVPPQKTKIIWCLTTKDGKVDPGALSGIDWGLRIIFDNAK